MRLPRPILITALAATLLIPTGMHLAIADATTPPAVEATSEPTPTDPTTPTSATTPTTAPTPTARPRTPSEREADAQPATPGYTDVYLEQWDRFQQALTVVDDATATAAHTATLLAEARTRLAAAQIAATTARANAQAATWNMNQVARSMYSSTAGDMGPILAILAAGDSTTALRAAETSDRLNGIAAHTTHTYTLALTAQATAGQVLTTAEADYVAAAQADTDAQTALAQALADADAIGANYNALLAAARPQITVGTDGCPITAPTGTLRNGADTIGVERLCRHAVEHAATPQAANAIKWALAQLGAPYACNGVGRLADYRFDCSSLVSRAYYEGADVPIAGDTWAPSTRSMTPWDGMTLDPHLAGIDPNAIRPGDLVLYNTCPQGGCGYQHVVMYLGIINDTPWMLHTNTCGDVAKVEPFWGFTDHNYEVTRRVLTTPHRSG